MNMKENLTSATFQYNIFIQKQIFKFNQIHCLCHFLYFFSSFLRKGVIFKDSSNPSLGLKCFATFCFSFVICFLVFFCRHIFILFSRFLYSFHISYSFHIKSLCHIGCFGYVNWPEIGPVGSK